MSRKIARITQEKKLLLANEVVESNAKTSLNSDGRLDTDEIIEYPAELEGGRNLLRNSNFNSGSEYWGGSFIITDEGALLESVAGRSDYIQNTTLIPEGEYVVQIRYRVVEGQAPYLYVTHGTDMRLPQGSYIFEIGDNEWQTVTFPVIVNSESRFYAIRYAAVTPVDHLEGKTLIKWIKLEKGSIATPWTPAPEDLGLNYPDSIQNFNSSISSNNIIAAEFIEGYPFVKPVIDDSLVLWLDGSTGNNYKKTGIWKDLSGNGNDGQLMNFDFTEDSGWVDGGLKFDGVDDWLRLGRQDKILDRASFTISFVLKIIEPHSVGVMLFGNEGLKLRIYSYKPQLILKDWGYSNSATELQQGTTHYVDFSYSDGRAKIYIDGTLSVDQTKDIEWDYQYYQQQGFKINEYASRYSDIIIYKISMYNRALTDEEILQNYQAGQCSPLLVMRGEVIG